MAVEEPKNDADETLQQSVAKSEEPKNSGISDTSQQSVAKSDRAAGDELEALRAENEELIDTLQRLKAEFDNYRKRAARDQESLVARAGERLVKELLPVLDDLERALEAAESHEEAKLEEGVKLVHRQLEQILEREGLAPVETDGKFDPNVHEALLTQPSASDEGSVIEVLQKGYRLGDRVLRPARVVVAGPKEESASDGDPA
ncbi:MAG: nucleotide exchange factor GrpE [Actinobacteria bacterium]|nr:MAG: nucleotide exchange factor GrpE [Actinomycetota bacterium]